MWPGSPSRFVENSSLLSLSLSLFHVVSDYLPRSPLLSCFQVLCVMSLLLASDFRPFVPSASTCLRQRAKPHLARWSFMPRSVVYNLASVIAPTCDWVCSLLCQGLLVLPVCFWMLSSMSVRRFATCSKPFPNGRSLLFCTPSLDIYNRLIATLRDPARGSGWRIRTTSS